MTFEADWEAAGGALCPRCHQEVVRFRDGVCLPCAESAEAVRVERIARRQNKQYVWRAIMDGHMTLSQAKKGKVR